MSDSLEDETDSPNAFSFPPLVWLRESESDSLTKLDSESELRLARSCSFFRSVALRSSFLSVSVTCLYNWIPRCFFWLTFYLCFKTWHTTTQAVIIAIRPRTDPIVIAIIVASVSPWSSTSATGVGYSTHSSSPSSQVVVVGLSLLGSMAWVWRFLNGKGAAKDVWAIRRIPFRYSTLASIWEFYIKLFYLHT